MKFEIVEKQKNKKCFEIKADKSCLKDLKNNKENFEYFEISAKDLNIDACLYGKNKKESIEIQKQNAKKVLKYFKICAKAVKILKNHKSFGGTFYVDGLSKKKNNNDLVLIALFDLKFNVKMFNKISTTLDYASQYFDKENEINNMCDFQDNLCVGHRERKKEGLTGCCPSFCKYTKAGVCNQKCLACKIFMCDHLIKTKGYYFTPHTVPFMMKHMTILERFLTFGLLFKTHKQTTNRIWGIRCIEIAFLILLLLCVVFCFI